MITTTMMGRFGKKLYKLIPITLLLLLLPTTSIAIDVKSYENIETKWGDTEARWSKFEYLDGPTSESTPLYWYHDYNSIKIGEKNITESFEQLNITYSTILQENGAVVFINKNIKEYKLKPYTEFSIDSVSDTYLPSMQPNFRPVSEGKYLLFPEYIKPASAENSKKGWEELIPEEFNRVNPADNWILIYDENKNNTLLVTNKKLDGLTSYSDEITWKYYFAKWKFEDVYPGKVFNYRYWLTPITITENDTVTTIKAKASDKAHEALVKSVKIFENKTRGYDYWLYEEWYKFSYVENEWCINPFKTSPHNLDCLEINDACVAAIYLPENATAVNGPEGYPVVFDNGKDAVGLYFKDSIIGPRMNNDKWFGNESAGGGFYLKKFRPEEHIVKIYYKIPAEPIKKQPILKNANVEIPKTSIQKIKLSAKEKMYEIPKEIAKISFKEYYLSYLTAALYTASFTFLFTGIRRMQP